VGGIVSFLAALAGILTFACQWGVMCPSRPGLPEEHLLLSGPKLNESKEDTVPSLPVSKVLLDISIRSVAGLPDEAAIDVPPGFAQLAVSVEFGSGAFKDFFLTGLGPCSNIHVTGSGVHAEGAWVVYSFGQAEGASSCFIPPSGRIEIHLGVQEGTVAHHLVVKALREAPALPEDFATAPSGPCYPNCG
jgi:hypothetical protein